MTAVYKREMLHAFSGGFAFFFAAFMLIASGIFVMTVNLSGYCFSGYEYTVYSLRSLYLLLIPLLTMRVFSEDRRQGTDKLLRSLPLRMSEVVLGKYFACITVLALPFAVMCANPLIFSLFGEVNFAVSYSAILAFYLLGAALTAIGVLISAAIDNQIIAGIVTLLAILINFYITALSDYVSASVMTSVIVIIALIIILSLLVFIMTKNRLLAAAVCFVFSLALIIVTFASAQSLSGLCPKLLASISLFDGLDDFCYAGIFNITTLVSYIAVSAVFNVLTVELLEKRRWA